MLRRTRLTEISTGNTSPSRVRRVALADHAVQRAEPRAGALARQQRDELGDAARRAARRPRNRTGVDAAGFAVLMMPASSTQTMQSVDDCTTLFSSASRRRMPSA